MSKNAEKLLDAIGQVRDEYVEEAHGTAGQDGHAEQQAGHPGSSKRKRRHAAGLAVAACLLVAFVGVLGVVGLLSGRDSDSANPGVVATDADSAEGAYGARDAEGYESDSMALEAEGVSAADAAAGASARIGAGRADFPDDKQVEPGDPFVLTAAEWNDNVNWPFFTNLVTAGEISFPSFGIDPRNRVKTTVRDSSGSAVRGEEVVLVDGAGDVLWRAQSDKDGNAFLFFKEGQQPAEVVSGGVRQAVVQSEPDVGGQQDAQAVQAVADVDLVVGGEAGETPAREQVMFIIDTTGSMGDELAYLQKDFASIAKDVGSDGVEYSVNFYRDVDDEYVTKCSGFTDDVESVQDALEGERATGGGDSPEAVARILQETITDNGNWSNESAKVAFLVFDAPPHEGTDKQVDEAVRSAAERGIRLVPVVASNAERDTELFGRALSICTDGTYVFLTDDSGVGNSHLQPIVGDYSVELLHDVIVRIIQESR